MVTEIDKIQINAKVYDVNEASEVSVNFKGLIDGNLGIFGQHLVCVSLYYIHCPTPLVNYMLNYPLLVLEGMGFLYFLIYFLVE